MNATGNQKIGIGLVFLFIIGIIVAVFSLRQQTQTKQQASEIVNVNTGGAITATSNKDGTMGPATWEGNYSNKLSGKELGSLTFSVTDPVQGKPSLPTSIPTVTVVPKGTVTGRPSITPQKGNENKPDNAKTQGVVTVKSLVIKITKIEVHLAFVGDKSNQTPADHWETLNMPQSLSVDLVQLANGGIINFGLTKLASGKYTEVRVYIQNATATLDNGTIVGLKILGKDGIVRVVRSFTIENNVNTNLVMDFDAGHSVIYNGESYVLKPVIAKLLENK